MKAVMHIDGGSRGNPGPAGSGVVITSAEGQPLHAGGYFLGKTTNNVAEYTGLIRGVEAALQLGVTDLTIRADSQLMVRQVNGQYKVKNAGLKPLHAQAKKLLGRLDGWRFGHVYRDDNQEADALANQAMDAKAHVGDAEGGGGDESSGGLF
jgi:ribonuclease HI